MTEYDLGKVVGDDGADGNGIASISKTGTSGLVDTYTITYDDGDSDTFTVTNGADGQTGATGNGIASVTKTGTSGLVDTYTILFTNGDSTTFTVTNGSDASVTIVTSFSGTTSDSKVASEKLVKDTLDTKLDNALSSSGNIASGDSILFTDYSDGNKIKKTDKILATQVMDFVAHSTIGTDVNATQYAINDAIDTALGNKVSKSSTTGLLKNDGSVDTTSYSTFSGSYSDLSNKPSIPSSSSDLSDGSDLVKKSSTTGLIKNDGSVMTGGTGSSNYAIGNHTHSGYVSTSDIADNLTTNDTTKVLSAKQGKALNDMIGSAITYIIGSGS